MKTPEEIKRDLIDYMEDASCVTEYGDAHDLIDSVEKGHATMADALAYIQQLEKDNAQKDERIRKLELEKETLLAGIKLHGGICMMCKYYSTPEYEFPCGNCCVIYPNDRGTENLWEWRGVEEEKHEQVD